MTFEKTTEQLFLKMSVSILMWYFPMIKVMLFFLQEKEKNIYGFLPHFHRVSSGVNGFCLSLHHDFSGPPSMPETWVQTLGWKDLLGKGMATDSSIFAWKISWTEDPDGLQSTRSQRVGPDQVTNANTRPLASALAIF